MATQIKLTNKLRDMYQDDAKEWLEMLGAVKFVRLPIQYKRTAWDSDYVSEFFTQLHGFNEEGEEVGMISLDFGIIQIYEEPRIWGEKAKSDYEVV